LFLLTSSQEVIHRRTRLGIGLPCAALGTKKQLEACRFRSHRIPIHLDSGVKMSHYGVAAHQPMESRIMRKVRKAVFPVAGLGTRFLPATKAIPKEMLTVVDKPVIQYVVDEAREAGIEHFIFVTGRNKAVIEDHFDVQFELYDTLAQRGK